MEFTADKLIILLAVVFPLLLLVAAIILNSGVCVIIPILVWIGIAVTMLFLPATKE
ncbi:MAG TPA: hypothetical protein VMS79_05570 [Methanomassiliicoccales archaeon]|nr:hypothetical protein [Methanomassiliicoccales archaeon]